MSTQRPTWFARLVVTLILLAAALSGLSHADVAHANPASHEFFPYVQPDGSTIRIRVLGDEFCNWFENIEGQIVELDAEGFWIVSEDQTPPCPREEVPGPAAATQGLTSVTAPAAAPPWATGTVNFLVIMVQFPADPADPDGAQPAVSCSFAAAQMQANLFGTTPTGPGNLDDYYQEISYGAVQLAAGPAGVVGCFTVANDKNDYDDGPSSAAALVTEAINLADASVNFAPYDNDGDGQVDNVAIVYAGCGPDNSCYAGANSTTNNLWPHASSIAPVAVDGGARTVSQYFIVPELLNNTPTIRTIGVFAHEFGHKLGLPDLYDTDNSSQGIGHWGLMGTGSWTSNTPGSENGEAPSHMGAWSKWFLGWIAPTNLTGMNVGTTVPQAETNAFAVQLLANPGGPDDWPPPASGEYFLVENRQQTAFDVGLDGCGLLVWHIDEALGANTSEGHTAGSHRLVDLEEADAPPEDLDVPEPPPATNTGNRGDAGDPFPGSSNNMLFDDTTTPHSRLYNGSNSGVRMEVISNTCAADPLVNFGNPGVDLAVTKTDSPDPVIAGLQLTYTIDVTNNGDGHANGVTVADTLPAEVDYVSSASTLGTCSFDGVTTVTCNLGIMAAGASATITIVVDVPPSVADGAMVTNTATVQGNQTDPVMGNNTVTEQTTVIRQTDLSIVKTGAPGTVMAGDQLTYTIDVTNDGPSDASGVTVTDMLPAGAVYDDAASSPACDEMPAGSGTVTCSIGDLPVGNSAEVTIVVTVTCDAVGGLTNTAEVAGNETDPDLTNNTDTADTDVLAEFGDAEDPPYPSRLASGGAYHCDASHEWLGVGVDYEIDADPDLDGLDSDGDGVDGDAFDDGVFPKAWYETGTLATLPILVSTSGEGVARYGPQASRRIYVQGWIDFDKDGSWSAMERVFTCNIAPGTHGNCNGFSADWLNFLDAQAFNVRFNVPKGILPPGQTWMRVRLSYGTPVGPTGPAEFGEVEDYQVSIFRGADP